MKTTTRRSLLAFATALLAASPAALAQSGNNTGDPLDPQPNGPRQSDPTLHVLRGATVHVSPDLIHPLADVVIANGRIVSVSPYSGAQAADIPAGALVHPMTGMHVYAGFIDAHLPIEIERPSVNEPGAHWNASVTPQASALDNGGVPASDASRLRNLGFTAAAIAPEDGIFAGRAAVVSLAEAPDDPAFGRPPVYRDNVYQAASFQRSGSNRGEFSGYPNSQMGAIALLRQTLSDADWEAQHAEPGRVSALAHLAPSLNQPLLFRTRDELEGLRAEKIAAEFNRTFYVLGTGTEFRRLDAIRDISNTRPTYILPLTLPETPEIDTIGKADSTDLRTLMTWEQAPTNARRLDDAGVHVSITADGLRRGEKFHNNLHEAIEKGGLAPARALAMLTTNPAEILGVAGSMGTVQPGNVANLVVATGDLFDTAADGVKILDVWVDGRRHEINTPAPPFDGDWTFSVGEFFSMQVVIDGKKVTTIEGEGDDANEAKARNVKMQGDIISFLVDDTDDGTGTYVVSGILGPDGIIRGTGLDAASNPFEWVATRTTDDTETGAQANGRDTDETAQSLDGRWPLSIEGATTNLVIEIDGDFVKLIQLNGETRVADNVETDGKSLQCTVKNPTSEMTLHLTAELLSANRLHGEVSDFDGNPETFVAVREDSDLPPEALPGYPFGAYATNDLPPQQTVIFHNATIWTCGPDGVIDNGWVAIENGKIVAVREGAVIDIMTENEAVSIDLEGRHLTPGLLDAHSHTGISRGVNESGQAVTAEVRIQDVTDPDSLNWYRQLAGGVTTVNNMHGSANPIGGQTQTNKVRWGAVHPDDMHMQGAKPGIKFALGENVKQSNWESPRTRYPQSRMGVETLIRDRFTAASEYARTNEHRRDLELEALAEILAGERLIHCHSYRQDEILMLCRVAEDFGFTIGTFQHGLEVYKVAEAVQANAIGASLFSDWWAYKVEVQDAIAQAGPLQTEAGVLTSYNSDSDELSRRMHVEAGKAYKYSNGRISKEDALKFVTINPAVQLGVGDRIGSIEVGKDADLAVWSGEPLSSFSMCEATWIDGREYFSLARDAELRAQNAEYRQRITQRILTDGAPKPKPSKEDPADGEGEDNTTDDDPPRSLRERMAAAARTQHYLNLYLRGINPADHQCGDCGATELQFGGNR